MTASPRVATITAAAELTAIASQAVRPQCAGPTLTTNATATLAAAHSAITRRADAPPSGIANETQRHARRRRARHRAAPSKPIAIAAPVRTPAAAAAQPVRSVHATAATSSTDKRDLDVVMVDPAGNEVLEGRQPDRGQQQGKR